VSVQSGQDSPLERVTNNPRKGGGQVNAGHRPCLGGSATCRPGGVDKNNPRKGGGASFRSGSMRVRCGSGRRRRGRNASKVDPKLERKVVPTGLPTGTVPAPYGSRVAPYVLKQRNGPRRGEGLTTHL
jgi:hypothetical protein